MVSLDGDIPRICTALADWLACMVVITQLPRRVKGWRQGVLCAAAMAVLVGFMLLTADYDGVWFNIFYTISVVLMLLFLYAAAKVPLYKAGYFCARAFLSAGLAASLMWQLYVYFRYPYPVLAQPLPGYGFMALCYVVAFGGLYLLENLHKPENKAMEINLQSLVTVAIMALVIYIISSISYVPINTPFSGSDTREIYNLRTLVYFGGVALLFAYHFQLCELQSQSEVSALQTMLHLQYETYKMNEESVALVDRKYHDLKHQIAVLRTQTGEQRNAVLDKMEREIKAYEAQNHTGNKVLDTVLTSKSLHCQANDIQLTCVADGAGLEFIDVVDISSLFGNALDNAIEGVSKISDPDKRLIHLSVARQKGFLRIRVENCYQGDLKFENGRPRTTKRDKRFHGYGLKSIESTVAKYGGSTTVQAKDGWFELRVLIPLPETCRD